MSVTLERQPFIKFGKNPVFDILIFNKFSNNGAYSNEKTICNINNDIKDLIYNVNKINNNSRKSLLNNRIKYYIEFIKNIDSFYL